MSKYNKEVKERWGETKAYKEYEGKTRNYTEGKWDLLKEKMQEIFGKFSSYLKEDIPSNDPKTQSLVCELQTFITNNFYTCTKEILKVLAMMYVCDSRFTEFIDIGGDGTSLYVLEAVKYYSE